MDLPTAMASASYLHPWAAAAADLAVHPATLRIGAPKRGRTGMETAHRCACGCTRRRGAAGGAATPASLRRLRLRPIPAGTWGWQLWWLSYHDLRHFCFCFVIMVDPDP